MKINISKEKPKIKLAWWGFGLGLGTFLIPVATSFLPDIHWGELRVIPALIIPWVIAATATTISAFRKGERSYVLWIGLVPIVLFDFLVIAEFISAIFGLGF